jgi:hypothetical protein
MVPEASIEAYTSVFTLFLDRSLTSKLIDVGLESKPNKVSIAALPLATSAPNMFPSISLSFGERVEGVDIVRTQAYDAKGIELIK